MISSGSLRVGLLHFTAPSIVGGVEAIIGRQAAALAVRGHRVVVLAGRGRPIRRAAHFVRIAALDSKYPPLLEVNQALKQGHVPSAFQALSAELEAALAPALDDLDVCVVHNALSLHFNLPLTAALHRLASADRLGGLVSWCHDLSWSNPLYADLLYEAYPWRLLKTRIKQAFYVVPSEDRRYDLARLADIPPDEVSVVPAGVDLAGKWALGKTIQRLLKEHELLQADPFILLPVRITRRKNIECAIRVTSELRKLGLRPKLLVTGPRGPHDPGSIRYLHRLQALIAELSLADQVILLQAPRPDRGPWKPTDAMMDQLYRAADLMLFPSSQEGFGIPVLEAGIVGLPTFCSDIAPFREIGGQQVEYFRLETPPKEIAARIAAFVQQDARYGLRKRVARNFNWETIVEHQFVPLLWRAASSRQSALSTQHSAVSSQLHDL